MLAARYGHYDLVKYLVDIGADVNAFDNVGVCIYLSKYIVIKNVSI